MSTHSIPLQTESGAPDSRCDGHPQTKAPWFLIGSPCVLELVPIQMTSLRLTAKNTPPLLCSRTFFTGGLRTQRLVLARPVSANWSGTWQTARSSCCQGHRSGLRALFEKRACPEKIFTQPRVGRTALQRSTCSARSLWLCLIDQGCQWPLYLI